MPELPVLLVQFEEPIPRRQLSAFRGAIIQHVGMGAETERYHNHTSDETFRYGYPLLQYKHFGGRPAILFIGDAVDDVAKLFKHPSGTRKLYLNGEPYMLRAAQTRSWLWELDMLESSPTYVLRQWLPFSQRNYERYCALTGSPQQQKALLERILRGNLLSMAKGLGWWVPGQLSVEIIANRTLEPRYVKRKPRQAFDLRFRANVQLQQWIGLGRNVSLGYGALVRRIAPRPALVESPENDEAAQSESSMSTSALTTSHA